MTHSGEFADLSVSATQSEKLWAAETRSVRRASNRVLYCCPSEYRSLIGTGQKLVDMFENSFRSRRMARPSQPLRQLPPAASHTLFGEISERSVCADANDETA